MNLLYMNDTGKTFYHAAELGDIEGMKACLSRYEPIGFYCYEQSFQIAAQKGHMHVLEAFYDKILSLDNEQEIIPGIFAFLAQSGNLGDVKSFYYHSDFSHVFNTENMHNAMYHACLNNKTDVVKWLATLPFFKKNDNFKANWDLSHTYDQILTMCSKESFMSIMTDKLLIERFNPFHHDKRYKHTIHFFIHMLSIQEQKTLLNNPVFRDVFNHDDVILTQALSSSIKYGKILLNNLILKNFAHIHFASVQFVLEEHCLEKDVTAPLAYMFNKKQFSYKDKEKASDRFIYLLDCAIEKNAIHVAKFIVPYIDTRLDNFQFHFKQWQDKFQIQQQSPSRSQTVDIIFEIIPQHVKEQNTQALYQKLHQNLESKSVKRKTKI